MKINLSYSEGSIPFTKKRMTWIIILSAIVFLHCRLVGITPLVLSIIGYRNYNKATAESVQRSQAQMRWAFITLIIGAVITLGLMVYIASKLLH